MTLGLLSPAFPPAAEGWRERPLGQTPVLLTALHQDLLSRAGRHYLEILHRLLPFWGAMI